MRQGTSRRWSTHAAPIQASRSTSLGYALPRFVISPFQTRVAIAALLLLPVLVMLSIQVAFAGRIYPGVRALGISVGGLTPDEARARLEERAAYLGARSLTVGYEELRWTVNGAHLGVQSDVQPIVEEAYALGREGAPWSRVARQISVLTNESGSALRSAGHDPATLAAFLDAVSGAVNRPTIDARLEIKPDGTLQGTEGTTGRRLVADATRARLESAIERPDIEHVALVVEETRPEVSEADLAPARQEAERLLTRPVVLRFEDVERQLAAPALATMARLDRNGVTLQRDAVKAWVVGLAGEIDRQPQNARFTWNGGEPKLLRESHDGRDLAVEETVELIMARAFDVERVVPLPVSVVKPEVSQADAAKLNVKGAIEVARTSFAGSSPPKQHNINLAAQRLNGVVVPPGKLFSFNKEVGSTTLDNGYKLGWGIANTGANVRTVPSVAGGICQVSTTLFHAVFWAGYQIEERNYHLYWIPGYTTKGVEGLDATVDEDAGLDFRFYNNSDDYLLVQSWTEGARVVFGLYGTKPSWNVKVTPGDRQDVIPASREQVVEEEPTLAMGQRLAVEGAQDGFRVVNVRTVTQGSDVRTLRMSSVYRTSRNVTLVGTGGRPPAPAQTSTNRPTRPSETTPTTRSTTTSQPAAPAAKPTLAPTNTPSAKPTAQPARPAASATPGRPAAAPAAVPRTS